MLSSRSINFLITFLFLLQTTIGVDPLGNWCLGTGTFASSDPYADNLAKLFSSLECKTPSSGFSSDFTGHNPDKSYGLALCRGDVSKSDCKTCVTNATAEITKRCPNEKSAIICDPEIFNNNTKVLLSNLAGKAVASKEFYATGETKLDESRTLYGLTQCTRDISSEYCKNCLDQIISELLSCCDAREGGRVINGSCNFRYELYPFVDA
ncbi:hypothetical protein ACFE04_017099 [Oxalis oulophora]